MIANNCRKERFFTRKEAKTSMKKSNTFYLNKENSKIMHNIYYCTECSAYHLTSIPKEEWRGI